MALNEVSIGWGVESSAYGTPATVDTWGEFLPGTDTLTKTPLIVKSEGLRYGGKVDRASRRVNVATDAGGGFGMELFSSGMGKLWRNALGTGASNLVGGTTYQQNYTLSSAMPDSLTIQKGARLSTDVMAAQTYSGCHVKTWGLEAQVDGIAKASFDFDIRNMLTATAFVDPTGLYPEGSLFAFVHGAITIGGTVTAPTTTALATGGTAVTNIQGFSLSCDNGLSAPSRKFGSGGLKSEPYRAKRVITGSLDVEYSDNVLRDAILADTELSLVLTFTSAETLSTGFATFQVYLPSIFVTGDMPAATGDIATMQVGFEVADDETNEPVVVAIRTADAAI